MQKKITINSNQQIYTYRKGFGTSCKDMGNKCACTLRKIRIFGISIPF